MRIFTNILLPCIIAAFLFSCSSCRHINKAPKTGAPWPAPHAGVFVSGTDTLVFNGDGESISWHFTEGMDSIGQQGSGTYAFLFDGGLWRYDAAERLDLFTTDGHRVSLGLGVPGSCTETTICIRRFDLPGRETEEEIFKLSNQ